MMISDSQILLADRLLSTGKPVIVVYVGGRPRTITKIVQKAAAVLIALYQEAEGVMQLLILFLEIIIQMVECR
jgi:beta-glucosidase